MLSCSQQFNIGHFCSCHVGLGPNVLVSWRWTYLQWVCEPMTGEKDMFLERQSTLRIRTLTDRSAGEVVEAAALEPNLGMLGRGLDSLENISGVGNSHLATAVLDEKAAAYIREMQAMEDQAHVNDSKRSPRDSDRHITNRMTSRQASASGQNVFGSYLQQDSEHQALDNKFEYISPFLSEQQAQPLFLYSFPGDRNRQQKQAGPYQQRHQVHRQHPMTDIEERLSRVPSIGKPTSPRVGIVGQIPAIGAHRQMHQRMPLICRNDLLQYKDGPGDQFPATESRSAPPHPIAVQWSESAAEGGGQDVLYETGSAQHTETTLPTRLSPSVPAISTWVMTCF